MSALEVESSVHYCEHLLYIQRSQRSMLCMLSQQFQKLQGCCDVVKGCEAGCLVPQVRVHYVFELSLTAVTIQALVLTRYIQQRPAVSRPATSLSNSALLQSSACYTRQCICLVHLPCVASQYIKPGHLLYHASLYRRTSMCSMMYKGA